MWWAGLVGDRPAYDGVGEGEAISLAYHELPEGVGDQGSIAGEEAGLGAGLVASKGGVAVDKDAVGGRRLE